MRFRSLARLGLLVAMGLGLRPCMAGSPGRDAIAAVRPQVTLIPSQRCSVLVQPELRLYSPVRGRCQVQVTQAGVRRKAFESAFEGPGGESRRALDLGGLSGTFSIECSFLDARGREIGRLVTSLEVVDTSTRSTQLLDGCWISLYHWSEDEGRHFNQDLGRLSAQEWRQQIHAMKRVGIQHVIIQNVFECDEYAGKHHMDLASYKGKAYYPSRAYKARHRLGTEDPIEAILAAADEVQMDVFLGVGLFAWFDFSTTSLRWHKTITRELFDRYGQHPSLYGWYVSEEIFGSLYHEWEFVKPQHHSDIRKFFKSYQQFVRKLTPTKPIALAPNNERFEKYPREWREILEHVDILIPFGFARDAEHMNLAAVASICQASGTRCWVDLEIFAWPLDDGLVPKPCPDLIKEIRTYDQLEQIYGYQFTGIMNPPESSRDLGGEKAKTLYRDYHQYYQGRSSRSKGAAHERVRP